MTVKPIDCDVHAAAPPIADLAVHLEEYWRAYVAECGFQAAAGLAVFYPPHAPTTGAPGGGVGLQELGAHLRRTGASHAIVNCVYGLEGLRNLDFASALASALNSWLAAEWLDRDERLRASIIVKAEDPERAVAEIERRAADRRFVQVLLPVRSERPYGNRSYLPVLQAAAAHSLPVAIHFGGATGNPPTPVGWPTYYIEEYVGMAHAFQAQLTSLLAEGVFQRLPDLRIVFAESGFTWLPSTMWRLQKEWKGLVREIPWVRDEPSETIRRQVRLTVQPIDGPPERARLLHVLEQIGSQKMLMYSSDHPHLHSQSFEEATAGLLAEAQRRLILRGNAEELYRL